MPEKELEIINKLGLHVRAATKLVQLATDFDLDIFLNCNGQTADAKSIMEVLMLAGIKGTMITIKTSGDDEAEAANALEQLVALFADKFGEPE